MQNINQIDILHNSDQLESMIKRHIEPKLRQWALQYPVITLPSRDSQGKQHFAALVNSTLDNLALETL